MTKARLADGRELDFPDDMPDEQIHAEVRKLIGGAQAQQPSPQGAAPMAPSMPQGMDPETKQMSGVRNQALMAVAQQMSGLNQTMARLCQDNAQTQAMLGQVVQAVGQLQQTIDDAARRITDAVMAPAVQTVTRKDGKITETRISKE
jgi:hypothetical protein